MERSKGQLVAYFKLIGASIPARGIRCTDGKFIRPDEQAMASFLNHKDVEFVTAEDDGLFRLTEQGRRLLKLIPQN
jgi:hypothetical protein